MQKTVELPDASNNIHVPKAKSDDNISASTLTSDAHHMSSQRRKNLLLHQKRLSPV